MTHFEPVIGLEIHVQLSTASKIFCACSTRFGAQPNTQVCPVCSGMPGTLPVLNHTAVEYILRAGMALNCRINSVTRFARKNYFYPDLPKGYQISQFEKPVAEDGYLEIFPEESPSRKIKIRRIHLEEDAGKSLHPEKDNLIAESYLDYNRCGVPLIEIVTEPDIYSSQEAFAFLTELKQLIQYLGISDCNMEEGSLRCDANISLRPAGSRGLGVKTELKNMNSFHGVQRALNYEIRRQEIVLGAGQSIVQETLLWDDTRQEARSMRGKEEAHDYRYFPEPDLVPMSINAAWMDKARDSLPELPRAKFERFVKQYQLPEYNAAFLVTSQIMGDYFEAAVAFCRQPVLLSNWMMGDLTKVAKDRKLEFNQLPINPLRLAELILLIAEGQINNKIAKTVFEKMLENPLSPDDIIKMEGLSQLTDSGEIETIIEQIVSAHPAEVEQYRSGKEKVLGFFVGKIMRQTAGKANPKLVNEILLKKLNV